MTRRLSLEYPYLTKPITYFDLVSSIGPLVCIGLTEHQTTHASRHNHGTYEYNASGLWRYIDRLSRVASIMNAYTSSPPAHRTKRQLARRSAKSGRPSVFQALETLSFCAYGDTYSVMGAEAKGLHSDQSIITLTSDIVYRLFVAESPVSQVCINAHPGPLGLAGLRYDVTCAAGPYGSSPNFVVHVESWMYTMPVFVNSETVYRDESDKSTCSSINDHPNALKIDLAREGTEVMLQNGAKSYSKAWSTVPEARKQSVLRRLSIDDNDNNDPSDSHVPVTLYRLPDTSDKVSMVDVPGLVPISGMIDAGMTIDMDALGSMFIMHLKISGHRLEREMEDVEACLCCGT